MADDKCKQGAEKSVNGNSDMEIVEACDVNTACDVDIPVDCGGGDSSASGGDVSDGGCGACGGGCRHSCDSCGGNSHPVLRYSCGCFVLSLFLVLMFFLLLGGGLVSVTDKIVGGGVDAAKSIVATSRDVVSAAIAECKRNPDKTVFVDTARLVSVDGVDKWVVAEVDREIVKHDVEFKKWCFSAALDIKSDVKFQYYVQLRDMRLALRSSHECKLVATLYFDALHLNTPVAYSVKSTLKGSYLPQVNKAAQEYLEKDFAVYLEDCGKGLDNIQLASVEARRAVETSARGSFLKLVGLASDDVVVEVVFGFDKEGKILNIYKEGAQK